MDNNSKRKYEKQYWADIAREESQNDDDEFNLAVGDYCAVYAKKNCIGCPQYQSCKDTLNSLSLK